ELSAEALVKMMVGRDISGFYKKDAAHHHTLGPVVLEVEHYSDGHRVRDVSFQLHAGEVLGLAGLVGSGRTEVARLIFGADRKTSGALRVKGKPIDIGGPAEAIAAGALPELRRQEADAGAALARRQRAIADLEAEAARVRSRLAELAERLAVVAQDVAREERLTADRAAATARLDAEAAQLHGEAEAARTAAADLAAERTATAAALSAAEARIA
ncbi:ATP-binding cassette domain-containing protein, partial [Mycobacterium tuberculosis]|nr:ATP-binding cassette domain-containing protein [Mycobacterium tuberculosis]